MALFAAQAEVDIIITTALIPGKTAPVLITQEMVEHEGVSHRRYGCRAGRQLRRYQTLRSTPTGVTIVGLTDLPSRMACQATSFMVPIFAISSTTWVGLTTTRLMSKTGLSGCPGNPRREVTGPTEAQCSGAAQAYATTACYASN